MSYDFKRYLKGHAGVTEEQSERLAKDIYKRSLEANELLLSKGEICKNFFYVEKGLLRFYSIDSAGKEHILEFAPEKWLVVDRASFYFDEPSEFYIDAIEETTVTVLDEEFINIASEISPQFRKYNERILQNHIRHLQKRIGQLIGTSAKERYLDFIEQYKDVTARVPQWMIASFLGITPESLSRIRRELSK
ncbi:Crp/Fnr family transcriptional regulator [Fodinibius salsisoli]|uniref:Crp/Fnr family transcriptional regulator n=1 Tax=Fodinibius salsisoli TaxID=2820877 RepID=A0ABT3PSX3_9BACT|nr:Crp/Fnr family transcriptional regulator [Fodinibius salsisoli]MCW9708955.1 Crp/Fnr family transcriptional regulator [Fodinibius salsisoli]